MAASPRFKIYSSEGEYMGSAKYAEDAAAFVAHLGDGATIRDGHSTSDIKWTQGVTGDAAESYDAVAALLYA